MDRDRESGLIWLIYCQLRGNINIEECLALSEYGLEQNPENVGFLWGKGVSLHKMGRHQEALAFLREAEEHAPFNREIQKDIQEVEKSIALQKQ